MPAATRDRILETSADLFGRQGYAATGVKQIVAAAQAPFASLYHFFPGGKQQLGAEAIRTSGARYGDLIDLFYATTRDPVAATEQFFAAAAETLVQTDYADACPIATIALEVASTNEDLRVATAEVFDDWHDRAAPYLERAGLDPATARRTVSTLIMLLEGAFLLSRASRSTAPLQTAGDVAGSVVRQALAALPD